MNKTYDSVEDMVDDLHVQGMKLDLIHSDPKPLLLVVTLSNGGFTSYNLEVMRKSLEEFRIKFNLPPFIVVPEGMTIEAIIDPRFKTKLEKIADDPIIADFAGHC